MNNKGSFCSVEITQTFGNAVCKFFYQNSPTNLLHIPKRLCVHSRESCQQVVPVDFVMQTRGKKSFQRVEKQKR